MPVHQTNVSVLISRSLGGQFTRVRDKIHTLVDPLSSEELWTRPYPYGNSIGHLLLHLTGNLNYYIGAQIAGTGYVRDRPREFADTSQPPKQDVLAAFDSAVDMVLTTLVAQGDNDWAAPFSGVGAEDIGNRFAMFLRCAAHADHHAGQIIYLYKQLSLVTRAQ
jgi:uncharacterized damage-inducible protein DinB